MATVREYWLLPSGAMVSTGGALWAQIHAAAKRESTAVPAPRTLANLLHCFPRVFI